MDNWIDLTNYGIAVAGLMVVLMGLIMSIFSRYQEEWDWKFFIILFSFLIAYVSFDLLSQFSLTMLGESAAMLSRIVENAVKHGRDPYAGPFHISIRTRKTDSGSEIVVTDNGCGFVPADGCEPHIALNNIRQRLELMCGGSLDISPGEEDGTVVTITIPDHLSER